MLERLSLHAADLMTASRILLTPVFVAMVLGAVPGDVRGVAAVVVFAAVAASDVWDGRVARRFGRAGRRGRFLDHFADISFLLPSLGAFVWLGVMPWWVPASVAASFTFYIVDSGLRSAGGPPTLVASRIGHAGGVSNYVLVGVMVCNHTAGIGLLSPAALFPLFCLVPIYSASSILARLVVREPLGTPGRA